MKKSLIVISILSLTALCANAELTTSDTVSGEYLLNHGHSSTLVETVNSSTARVNGEEYIIPPKKSKFETFVRRVYSYIDPGQDDDWMFKHDAKPYTNYEDL